MEASTLKNLDYIRVSMQEKSASISTDLLKNKEAVTPTVTTGEVADKAYKLETGVLKKNESKTFDLRLWMDESTPVLDEVMNKTFTSKITVTTTLANNVMNTKNMMIGNSLGKNIFSQGEKYNKT